MEAELSEFSCDNKALQLAMAQKDLRLDATTKEMLQERQKVTETITQDYNNFSYTPPPPKIARNLFGPSASPAPWYHNYLPPNSKIWHSVFFLSH